MRVFFKRRHFRARHKAQGLVEYALIISLVALVVIVALFPVALAVERIFGVVGGALGTTHNDQRPQTYIDLTQPALCIASKSQNLTGLWVTGDTNESIGDLMGSTNLSTTGLNGATFTISGNTPSATAPGGASGYKFNPLLANGVDLSVCPQSVVIQAKDGTEAFAPVIAQVGP